MQKILEIAITIYSGKDNLYKEELEESIGIIVNMIFTHYVLVRGKMVRHTTKKNFTKTVFKYIRQLIEQMGRIILTISIYKMIIVLTDKVFSESQVEY